MSIEKAFIGNPGEIKETVVVSPVFYPNRFGMRGERTSTGNIIVHDKFTFIKTYPCSCWVYDTVLCLRKTKTEKIIFIGTAGSLSSKYRIGDIVFAKNKNIKSIIHQLSKHKIDIVSVKSCSSLLDENRNNINKFIEQKYDAVDLETESFYKACRKINKTGLAILVIQDNPLSKPFYKKLPYRDEERLKAGIEKIIELCRAIAQSR